MSSYYIPKKLEKAKVPLKMKMSDAIESQIIPTSKFTHHFDDNNNNNNNNNDSNDSMDDNDNNTENENDNEEGSSMNCENENFGEQESEGSSSVRTITPTSTSELIEERISHTKK